MSLHEILSKACFWFLSVCFTARHTHAHFTALGMSNQKCQSTKDHQKEMTQSPRQGGINITQQKTTFPPSESSWSSYRHQPD